MRFLLVDEILELVPGQHIRATKTMDPGEELFEDHFPGFPVVPGVLLTEMMAQAAGKCLAAEDAGRGRPMLAKITSASFREWVTPGQVCAIEAWIRSSRARFATAECRRRSELGRVVARVQPVVLVRAEQPIRMRVARRGSGAVSEEGQRRVNDAGPLFAERQERPGHRRHTRNRQGHLASLRESRRGRAGQLS